MLAFYLTFLDILSDALSDIFSGTWAGIQTDILSETPSDILSIYLTYILTFYLASILACYCIVFGFPRSSLLMILRNWNDTVTACGRSTICFQRIRSNGQQREKGTTSKLQLECLQKLTHHCVKLAFASDFADLAWASSIYGKYGSKSVELSSKSWIIQLNLLDLLHNFCNMGNRRFNLLQLFLSTYCSYLYLILGARFFIACLLFVPRNRKHLECLGTAKYFLGLSQGARSGKLKQWFGKHPGWDSTWGQGEVRKVAGLY